MIAERRPTAVLVLAILNIVIGSLFTILALCSGLSLLLAPLLARVIPFPPGQPNPLLEMQDVYRSIPGFVPVMSAYMTLWLLTSVLLILGGVGMLKMRPWGRKASLIYAVYTLAATVANTAYTVVLVNPPMQKYTEKMLADVAKQGAPNPLANNFMMSGAASTIGAIVSMLFYCAYPVVLLVVLNQRQVKAAFAGLWSRQSLQDGPEPGESDDDYDRPAGRAGSSASDDRTEILGEPPRPHRDRGKERDR